MAKTKSKNTKQKEYIITYRSEEHYEVLGYVKAASLEAAKKQAQKKLLGEAKYYNVENGEIDEIVKTDKISFDIK